MCTYCTVLYVWKVDNISGIHHVGVNAWLLQDRIFTFDPGKYIGRIYSEEEGVPRFDHTYGTIILLSKANHKKNFRT